HVRGGGASNFRTRIRHLFTDLFSGGDGEKTIFLLQTATESSLAGTRGTQNHQEVHRAPRLSAAAKFAFAEEAVVMTVQQMRFNLPHGIQHDPHNNQQTGTAKETGDNEVDVEVLAHQ